MGMIERRSTVWWPFKNGGDFDGHYSTEKWNLNRSHWIINMDLYIISLLKDSIYVVLHILGSGNIV